MCRFSRLVPTFFIVSCRQRSPLFSSIRLESLLRANRLASLVVGFLFDRSFCNAVVLFRFVGEGFP